jgi:hypothetical protein
MSSFAASSSRSGTFRDVPSAVHGKILVVEWVQTGRVTLLRHLA